MKTCETCNYFYHIGSEVDVFYCDFLKRRFSKKDNAPCNAYKCEKRKTKEGDK